MDGDLAKWRALLAVSGFGMQNNLVVAEPALRLRHPLHLDQAGCTRAVAPAYSFARGFPQPHSAKDGHETAQLLDELGEKSESSWELSGAINASLRR